MGAWMRMAAAGMAAGTLAVLAGCESDDEDDDTGEADGPTVATNVVVTGGQANEVIITNMIPDNTPVNPSLNPPVNPLPGMKPDLAIIDFFPVEGDFSVWLVRVTVKNLGLIQAGAFDIYLYDNGEHVDRLPVPGLLAGKQATFTFPRFFFGCHDNAPPETFVVTADPANKIKESDEANNTRQEVWNCPPL